MKLGFVFLFLGIIVAILGTVFHFQGKSKIGPESSFMYANPDWILYGMEIVSAGIIIVGIGITIIIIQRKKSG